VYGWSGLDLHEELLGEAPSSQSSERSLPAESKHKWWSSDLGKIGKEIQLASPRATTVECVDPGAGELSALEFVNVNLRAYAFGDLYAQKVSKKVTSAPAIQISVQYQ
jgi:hypothetical protein